MKISILTLFPDMFAPFKESIIKRAIDNNYIEIEYFNIRDYAFNKHRKVDDYPYGGGAGMVMSVDPLKQSILAAKDKNGGKVIFFGPRGKTFNQEKAKELALEENLIFVCGHYEGIDERAYKYIDEEISLGDFILTGGEMAAIPIVDSILRMVPGVLSNENSGTDESFSENLLEYPQYTRPEEYENMKVPSILLSGHHENVRKWRKYKSLEITRIKRNDLFLKYTLSKEDKKILRNYDVFIENEDI